jgi:energy-converting hydrogenase Eha subunit C
VTVVAVSWFTVAMLVGCALLVSAAVLWLGYLVGVKESRDRMRQP